MNAVKYPRTGHLPGSAGRTDDDVDSAFSGWGQRVILTEKMDGENTTIYSDYVHARSLDGRPRPDQSWVRKLAAEIGWQIPEDVRICGENLYARHSVAYADLSSYFMVFSIWTNDFCHTWDATSAITHNLGLVTVPVLFDGEIASVQEAESIWRESRSEETSEGFVVRSAGAFRSADFGSCVGKWVRPNHVQTGDHWTQSKVVPNGLAVPSTQE